MTTESAILKALEQALAGSSADETEIIAYQTQGGLTRVANSAIHQNVAETNSAISVRAVIDNRIGTARTNRPEPEAIKETVEIATANAKLAPSVDDWPGLPVTQEKVAQDQSASGTVNCSPGKRAELVHEALTVAKNEKLVMAGALQTGKTELYLGNNHGPINEYSSTEVDVNMVLMAMDSSGYSAWIGRDIGALDIRSLARRAADKAEAGRKPQDLEPGAYTVILEPPAVADMLAFLAYVGLGALSVQEKRSFMTDRFGEQVVDEKITFWDDARDQQTVGPIFDFEGVDKQKVVFFEKGKATDVVYDTRTAAREGKQSTGHALPAPNSHGPLPTNLILASGDTDIEKDDFVNGARSASHPLSLHQH